MNDEIKREALFYPNLKIEIKTVKDNSKEQIEDIEEFISEGVDLLIVSPNEAKAITPVVEKAYDGGIPVVLVDRKIASDKYTAFVGGDNYLMGEQVGTYIANRLNGKGRIVELTGLKGSTPALERHKGMNDVLKNFPSIEIIATADAAWLKANAENKFDSILSIYKDIDLVFAQNDPMAAGAYETARKKGREKEMLFVGVDALAGEKLGVELVTDSILDATFIYPTGGDKAIQVAMNILEKKKYERENLLSSALVNAGNARIMQMQTSHIKTLDDKIKILNEKLDTYLMRYSSQKMFLYACIVIAILLAVLLFFVVRAYWTKIRLNAELAEQKQQLEEQRDQLIDLSQKLEEATKAKLSFFTNVSHDFRTPLTLIADPVKRLMESKNIKEEEKFLLNIINKNVTVLLRLINQIMDFRKFENGKLEMHLSEFNIMDCMKEWAEAFRTLSYRKHITFRFNAEEGDYNIIADAEMMERITYNLLSNAFKFTPENGCISICLRRGSDNKITMKFTDTGAGMPAEHVKHIFESFYQIDVHHAGSGIGLALVKAFVEMHHGEINVESTEGSGTVFTICIPVKQDGTVTGSVDRKALLNNLKEGAVVMADQESLKADNNNAGKKDVSKGIVLVIDDNQDVKIGVKKRPIMRVTDLTYENIRHISAEKLMEVLDRNFGGGWDSLSQSIQDIIQSGFDISTTTLPKDRLHKPGGMYEKKVADGFAVLEITKGAWIEAIFAKLKPESEKPRLKFGQEDNDKYGSEEDDDDEDLPEIDDKYNDDDDDDDAFDDDKLTEESYRTTIEENPEDLDLSTDDVADDDEY